MFSIQRTHEKKTTFTETLRHPAVRGQKREVTRIVRFEVGMFEWSDGRRTAQIDFTQIDNGVVTNSYSTGDVDGAIAHAADHDIDLTVESR